MTKIASGEIRYLQTTNEARRMTYVKPFIAGFASTLRIGTWRRAADAVSEPSTNPKEVAAPLPQVGHQNPSNTL